MSSNVTWDGSTYSIPASGEINWPALRTYLIALAGAGVAKQMTQAVRKALTTPVTVSATTDFAVATKLTSPGAVTVNLPAGVAGQVFVIVDDTGDAGSNNITINRNGADTIAGATTLVLDHNRQAVMLGYNSSDTDWKVLYKTTPPGTIVTADLASAIGLTKGGTGQTTANAALNALLPSQGGNSGKALTTNATDTSWTSVLTNPMTTTADMIVSSDNSGTPARFAKGTANQVIGMNSGATAQEYKTLAVGTSGSDFAVAQAANSVTFNLPDAGASARGAVTTGTQTMAGAKTWSGAAVFSSTIAATGLISATAGIQPATSGTGTGTINFYKRSLNDSTTIPWASSSGSAPLYSVNPSLLVDICRNGNQVIISGRMNAGTLSSGSANAINFTLPAWLTSSRQAYATSMGGGANQILDVHIASPGITNLQFNTYNTSLAIANFTASTYDFSLSYVCAD